MKKNRGNIDKPSVQIYANKIENRITFKIKDRYTLELLTKPFGSLLEISPKNHNFLKTLNSKYSEIKVWFTDQNGKVLEIEDRINLTLVIK